MRHKDISDTVYTPDVLVEGRNRSAHPAFTLRPAADSSSVRQCRRLLSCEPGADCGSLRLCCGLIDLEVHLNGADICLGGKL